MATAAESFPFFSSIFGTLAILATIPIAAFALSLAAPLAPNRNHKSTAFGGSLYSVAVLAGWGLLQIKLQQAGVGGQVVIARSEVDYVLPVRGDFEARCELASDDASWQRALRTLQRHGRCRQSLEVAVRCGGVVAMNFRGDYAVHAL